MRSGPHPPMSLTVPAVGLAIPLGLCRWILAAGLGRRWALIAGLYRWVLVLRQPSRSCSAMRIPLSSKAVWSKEINSQSFQPNVFSGPPVAVVILSAAHALPKGKSPHFTFMDIDKPHTERRQHGTNMFSSEGFNSAPLRNARCTTHTRQRSD
jgi:hypothetical protein